VSLAIKYRGKKEIARKYARYLGADIYINNFSSRLFDELTRPSDYIGCSMKARNFLLIIVRTHKQMHDAFVHDFNFILHDFRVRVDDN